MFQLKNLILTLLHLIFRRIYISDINPIFQVISKSSVTASVAQWLASSSVDRGFESRSG